MSFNKQTIEILEKPFAKSDIKERDGGFGKTLSYVEGHAVTRRLNHAFGSMWNFEIKEHTLHGDHLVVLGKLTVPTEDNGFWVTKESYGGSKLKKSKEKVFKDKAGKDVVIPADYVDVGNDFKAAATDALKKCATLLGVALDLYGSSSEGEDVEDEPKPRAAKPNEAEVPDTASQPINAGQIAAINSLSKKAKKEIADVLKTLKLGDKLEALTMEQAGKVITALQAK